MVVCQPNLLWDEARPRWTPLRTGSCLSLLLLSSSLCVIPFLLLLSLILYHLASFIIASLLSFWYSSSTFQGCKSTTILKHAWFVFFPSFPLFTPFSLLLPYYLHYSPLYFSALVMGSLITCETTMLDMDLSLLTFEYSVISLFFPFGITSTIYMIIIRSLLFNQQKEL